MTGHTDVFLVTGFLGSGKTTLVNRLIKACPADLRLMILINEFGELGIDGRLLEGDDLEVLEISKGSIFCACVKTDFIKGLVRIANQIRPHLLVVEATGTANPADMKRNLKLPLFGGRFRFREQFCLIDAQNFGDTFDTFTSVEKQIQSATVFVINKADLVSEKEIERICQTVSRYHSAPLFFRTTYADIPLRRFLQPAEHSEGRLSGIAQGNTEDLLPPDNLVSAVYGWRAADLRYFGRWAAGIPRGVVRIKGFLRENEQTFLFSWVMGRWEIREVSGAMPEVHLVNKMVLIGDPRAMDELAARSRHSPWARPEPGAKRDTGPLISLDDLDPR